ncbi:MAG: copper oxidase, partial [Myxococcaceae bacterium]|nr:copper oxidase [Myxococcaceae bacterium]
MTWKKRTAGLAMLALFAASGPGCDGSGGGSLRSRPGAASQPGGDGEEGAGGKGGEEPITAQHAGNGSLTDLFSGGASSGVRNCNRWIKADVVALDQPFVYNRFGAFNPVGMIFALRRDVESMDGGNELRPGNVRLEEDERPRPLVLRVNKGDCLEVKLTNLLDPKVRREPEAPEVAELAEGMENRVGEVLGEDGVPWHVPMRETLDVPGRGLVPDTGNGRVPRGARPGPQTGLNSARPPGNAMGDGPGSIDMDGDGLEDPMDGRNDAPATRRVGFHVQGLQELDIDSDGSKVGRNDSSLVDPGESRRYRFLADREGTFLFLSGAHLAGDQGDNAALAAGFFGAVNVEPEGSEWYRSQVTERDLKRATRGHNPDGTPKIDFEAEHNGKPILNMLDDDNEIIYGDLTAIIADFKRTTLQAPTAVSEGVFREITSIFHDEIQVVQAFPELDDDPTLEPIGDGFAINYGSDAFGPRVIANRKRVGPNKDCVECKFEEFFLSSWPSGDPALIVEKDERGKAKKALFPDDPSNVYHSYLGDPVWIRSLHAGPRETHVFHLHAHQWLHSPADDDSSYFDSETISPGSAFTYVINFGGGGNRNFTVGDAIFHCHLYPHFAAGMWAHWRNHDVFEDGSEKRNLPDGEIKDGTPTPAVVPLPGRPMPPMPTYEPTQVKLADGTTVTRPALPGFPFYIAANAGHRASQPPRDLEFDGGLPRHLITRVKEAEVGDFRDANFGVLLEEINIKLIPDEGTPLEQNAMDFHAGKLQGGRSVTSRYGFPAAAYPAFTPEGDRTEFLVNGQGAKPGAPFANPCPVGTPERTYLTAAIQLDMVVNNDGWHDPQGRIVALEQDVEGFIGGTTQAQPLVMRFNSGECAVVHLTNMLPGFLLADDFQIDQPTDIVGQHVHLVKFDVTSSDGAENGFNYEDGAFGTQEVQERIRAANRAGGAFKADGTTQEGGERVKLKAQQHPRIASAPLGAQTHIQRWWADPIVNGEGEDKTVGTTFTHDHFSPAGHQQHGLYAGLAVEPAGSVWRDSETGEILGTRDDGGPAPEMADILTVDPIDSFREYNLTFHDFALLYDRRGKPINPPNDDFERLPIAIENPENPIP